MNRICTALWIFAGLACFCLTPDAFSNPSNISYAVDGAGQRSDGGSISNISAVAQQGGVRVSKGGSLVNYAGFLNTFSTQPGLDTDGDGLENEIDPDNDNDSLADDSEITGAAHGSLVSSDPNAADSDSDGLSDADEAFSQTDPTDANAGLGIVKVDQVGDQYQVDYRARGGASGGRTYLVHSDPHLDNLVPEPMATNVTPAGGDAPWYVVTNTYVTSTLSNEPFRVFAVEDVTSP